MALKRPPLHVSINTEYRRQLDNLYARRSTIDELIESLQKYDRYRALSARGEESKREWEQLTA